MTVILWMTGSTNQHAAQRGVPTGDRGSWEVPVGLLRQGWGSVGINTTDFDGFRQIQKWMLVDGCEPMVILCYTKNMCT